MKYLLFIVVFLHGPLASMHSGFGRIRCRRGIDYMTFVLLIEYMDIAIGIGRTLLKTSNGGETWAYIFEQSDKLFLNTSFINRTTG